MNTEQCPNCASMMHRDAASCPICGEELRAMSTERQPLAENSGIATMTLHPASKIRTRIPAHVLDALARRTGKYSDMISVFHCIQLAECHWVGVAGDGDNGSYEHFSLKLVRMPDSDFKAWKFECSDVGYGDTAAALRDILIKEVL